MRSWRKLIATLALGSFVLGACTAPMAEEKGTASRKLAFIHVNVIPMTEEIILVDRAVLVADGRILRVMPAGEFEPERGMDVIDGQGGYLLPGLSDMHVHLGLKLPADGPASRTDMERDLGLYLPHGVTTIRHMRGSETALELREDIRSGKVIGPRLVVAGPSINKDLPQDFGPNVRTAEEAWSAVQEQAAAGYDLIKVHQHLEKDAFLAVIEAATNMGLPVAGHAQPDLEQTIRYHSLEHAEEVSHLLEVGKDFNEAPETLEALVDADITVTPTLIVFETIHKYLSDDGLKALLRSEDSTYVSPYWRNVMSFENNYFRQALGEDFAQNEPYFRDESERLKTLTRQLHEAGVPLMIGTDAVGLVAPGLSVHQELELLVEAGLTPYEALCTATVVPAEWLGEGRLRGRIEEGMQAEFVLLRQNPLLNISHSRTVLGVIQGTNWYDQKTLQAMLVLR